MTEDQARLASRQATYARLGKYAMVCAILIWLVMILFTPTPGLGEDIPTFLLSSNMRFVSAHLEVMPLDIIYMWGGSTTVAGITFLAIFLILGGFGTLVWRRLKQSKWSLGGVLMIVAGVIAYAQLFGRPLMLYPAIIDESQSDSLIAAIERQRPGLVRQLREGGSPETENIGRIHISKDGSNPALAVLRDKRTVAGLKFFLAQRAMDDGDASAVRRMLPLTMPRFQGDLLAENAFAYRLLELEKFSGKPAVPPTDRQAMLQNARAWSFLTGLVILLRPVMQAMLLSGIVLSVIGWNLRRRLHRIRRMEGVLETAP